jgi:hypothetical protein
MAELEKKILGPDTDPILEGLKKLQELQKLEQEKYQSVEKLSGLALDQTNANHNNLTKKQLEERDAELAGLKKSYDDKIGEYKKQLMDLITALQSEKNKTIAQLSDQEKKLTDVNEQLKKKE